MKIQGIAICPPPGAKDSPAVTPELLASCLARYSRSNKGIQSILSSIDWNDPDKSVDAIFRFVDYGHASITGMTGGIAMVIDGCSMFLAYKLFELAQLCDGQESSTRYIKLDKSNLPSALDIGVSPELTDQWEELMELSFSIYHDVYQKLDQIAQQDISVVRIPDGATPKVVERLRKNYALDRSRYFIPFATRTNVAMVMTARVWSETIKQLDSLPLLEAKVCAEGLRQELSKFVPRLSRHCHSDDASRFQAKQIFDYAIKKIKTEGVATDLLGDDVWVEADNRFASFLPELQDYRDAFNGKVNRYSTCGTSVKRVTIRAAWNNLAIAELRDLNRHRSGYRFTPLTPVGFYLPSGVNHEQFDKLMRKKAAFIERIVLTENAPAYVYGLLLGTQVPFEHSTHLDKFIYEIELRTGLGAHFRYAEHLSAACKELIKKMPQLEDFIEVGTAEPE
ncbi:MAG TPA: FAD-dependent thymidylate synthase [Chitinispirillaceae bacterium]|nr:FAD-dependent thymidylate synthase [Chitinispirillaceae bacterium]